MSSSPKIRLLPEHLIDQIKAGEVIERPANVLKELIENAIDAGSTKIDVEIRENGLALLRVTDNGQGIASSDLELAFGRHATSKIERFEDIYRLSTFGFRGEALPSIASISRMECVSWREESKDGASVRFEGGIPQGVFSAAKSGAAHGTIMTIKDLFFNTPVRLKFMQSTGAEKNWLKRFFYAFVLAYPEVSFSVQWDDSEKLLYPKSDNSIERIRQFFSAKNSSSVDIQESLREWQGLSCRIILVQSNNLKIDGPIEHVLINKRPVLDKSFQRIAQQVLEKYWPGMNPSVFISLEVPGDQVDVNVHPNKTVVKFHQHGEIISLITATLRECIPQQNSNFQYQPQIPVSNPSANPSDLLRDREESYTQHLEHFSSIGPDEGPSSAAINTATFGPYFIHQAQEQMFYVNGKEVLSSWVKLQLSNPSESLALLVSHPLRNTNLSQQNSKLLQNSGFELDELEKNFWVIRAIPTWLKGIPLEVGVPLILCSVGIKGIQIDDFAYESLSPGKWNEIWSQMSLVSLLEEKRIISISPKLFTRDSK